jgi:hypothetical protein
LFHNSLRLFLFGLFNKTPFSIADELSI